MDSFIKGSSIVAAIPTLLYVGMAQNRNRLQALSLSSNPDVVDYLSIPYETIVVGILISYGVTNIVMNRYKDDEDRVPVSKIILCGASLGLFLSTVGRFGLDLPTKMFKLPPSRAFTVHPIAMVMYVAIMFYVNKILNL